MKNYGILSNEFTHSLFIELTLYFDKKSLSVFVSKANDLPSIILIVRKFSGNVKSTFKNWPYEMDRVIPEFHFSILSFMNGTVNNKGHNLLL